MTCDQSIRSNLTSSNISARPTLCTNLSQSASTVVRACIVRELVREAKFDPDAVEVGVLPFAIVVKIRLCESCGLICSQIVLAKLLCKRVDVLGISASQEFAVITLPCAFRRKGTHVRWRGNGKSPLWLILGFRKADRASRRREWASRCGLGCRDCGEG